MAKVEQEYEGSADNINVKSNKKYQRISMSVPISSTINIKVSRNKKYRLFVGLSKPYKKDESDKPSAKEEG